MKYQVLKRDSLHEAGKDGADIEIGGADRPMGAILEGDLFNSSSEELARAIRAKSLVIYEEPKLVKPLEDRNPKTAKVTAVLSGGSGRGGASGGE